MGEIRLFHQVYGRVFPLESNPFPLEEPLHEQIEKHLLEYLGVCFLDHEVVIGASELDSDEEGRIDTLGIDSEGRPVIVEYKRDKKQDVVQQVLDYRDWLLKNRPMFRELVRETDQDCTDKVVWQPRLIVIAGEITQKNLREAKRNKDNTIIELVRYRRFGDDFLTLEWVYGESKLPSPKQDVVPVPEPVPAPPEPIPVNWDLVEGREELCGFITTLGSDVTVTELETYTRFNRHGRDAFATVRRQSTRTRLVAHAGLDPRRMRLEDGFTRDVARKGKHGIGDLEIRIGSRTDLEKARPLLREAYERT